MNTIAIHQMTLLSADPGIEQLQSKKEMKIVKDVMKRFYCGLYYLIMFTVKQGKLCLHDKK